MARRKETLCPLLRKPCLEADCTFWIHIRGQHPQTGQPVDQPGCAIVWQPILMIENSAQQRATGAAIESFRNEMVTANEISQQLLIETAHQNRLTRK